MAVSSADYTGSTVIINDAQGNHLCSTVVTLYDKGSMRIEVEELPGDLAAGYNCSLLILAPGKPYEYQGRVIKEGANTSFALYRGHELENRQSERYKISTTALVENLVCDGRAYPLHTPLEVVLINISKSGVRFRAPYFAMTDTDRFQMRMRISQNEKLLIADVVNHMDIGSEASEYGCLFLIGSEKVV